MKLTFQKDFTSIPTQSNKKQQQNDTNIMIHHEPDHDQDYSYIVLQI